MVDPGIEFGKLLYQDLELLRRLPELGVLGYPVLVAVSRKHFIGNVLGLPRTTAWRDGGGGGLLRLPWGAPGAGARRAGDGAGDADGGGLVGLRGGDAVAGRRRSDGTAV